MTEEEQIKLAVIEEKVDGINHRLDTMNGTVATTKGRVKEVEDFILIEKAKNKAKAWVTDNIMGIVSTIVSGVAVFLLLKHLG